MELLSNDAELAFLLVTFVANFKRLNVGGFRVFVVLERMAKRVLEPICRDWVCTYSHDIFMSFEEGKRIYIYIFYLFKSGI